MRCSTMTSTNSPTSAMVSITLAKSGRFWPRVVSANAGLMSSGTVAPNITTNGAMAQLMCSPNRFTTRQKRLVKGISGCAIEFWMT